MAFLTVTNVSKSFGDTIVLSGVSLLINPGDAVGLVGANGVGKSTLLKMVVGELAPDAGTVAVDPACTIGYLPQALAAAEGQSVEQVLAAARGNLDALEERLRALEQAMAEADPLDLDTLLADYAVYAQEFEARGGYARHEADEVLAGLGLAAIERSRPLATLSGGEKARLGLAALLLQGPELLLLDEPTNHLDIAALEWLEGFLANWRGALLVVSHDRRFLDRTVRTIVEIDEQTRAAQSYAGNYTFYAEAKAQERARRIADYAAQQEEIRELRRIIKSKGRQVAHNRPPSDGDKLLYNFKGARVEAAIARNVHAAEEKLRRIEEDPLPKPPRPLVVNPEFNPALFGSKTPLALEAVSKSYGARRLLEDVSCVVESRARIVITGPNGTGKSTLLKILAGLLRPDAGRVHRAPGVRIGYLDQEQETLAHGATVYAHYASGLEGDFETLKADLLATGLFTWPELARPIEVLSVGQKRKLQIARLLAVRANVLLLDEPTNHISLDVLEQFEQALIDFAGPIVAISHDRRFIERLAQEQWEVQEGALVRTLLHSAG